MAILCSPVQLKFTSYYFYYIIPGTHIPLAGIGFPFILISECRNIISRAQTLTTLKHKPENKRHIKLVLPAVFSGKIKP